MIKYVLFLGLIIVNIGCNSSKDNYGKDDTKAFIKRVLLNLDTIRSASYFNRTESYAPGDSIPLYVNEEYVKMYSNPADTFVGAAFVNLLADDTLIMRYCYDGKMRSRIDRKNKTIEIDSFYHNPYPFRTVWAPFFTRIKTLFEYSLDTSDSIELSYEDYGDSLCIDIFIFDKVIEIVGNRMIVSPPLQGTNKGKVSRYFIWVNKIGLAPYKFRREMPHNVSVDVVRDVKFGIGRLEDFSPVNYFPAGYTILYGKNKKITPPDLLKGKKAPDWNLLVINNKDSLRLYDVKSKVVLIEFTSITCGPCNFAILFWKSLKGRYTKQQLDVVSIEGFIHRYDVLKRYLTKNDIDYKFLMSTDKVTQGYNVSSIPVFFILDEEKVVRKVFYGYREGVTDKNICNAIDGLLED